MKTIPNFERTFILFLGIPMMLAGCGGGGDSEVETKSMISSTGSTVYAAIRAVNDRGESSGLSDEISTAAEEGSEVEITFTEPNRQLDDGCLLSEIQQYVVHYGSQSGDYSNEVEIPRNDPELACTAVDSHPECGDITRCSISLSI
jgi:hypothetical protein